jgi:hypothetical protein
MWIFCSLLCKGTSIEEDRTYVNIDKNPRDIYERKIKVLDRISYKPVCQIHRTITGSDAHIDKSSHPTFDAEKLKKKIEELRNEVENDPNHFPHIHVHEGEDITPFVKARYVQCEDDGYLRTTLNGWLYQDTEESFKHSCSVIAKKYGAKPDLVEAAIWLKNVYYMDGEGGCDDDDLKKIYSFDHAHAMYGIRDMETFRFMNDTYGYWFHCDIAKLAQLLDDS